MNVFTVWLSSSISEFSRLVSDWLELWPTVTQRCVEQVSNQHLESTKTYFKSKIDFRALKILSSLQDEHFHHKTQFARVQNAH